VTHPDQEIDRLADRLLGYLREQLDKPGLAYVLPLTRLLGGFDTTIYRFKLRGASRELSRCLVLRLYRERDGAKRAVWQSRIQNALAEEGYPVAFESRFWIREI
jgi:hypothetical protein